MSETPERPGSPPEGGTALETTAALLSRVRAGDDQARDRLIQRYFNILERWAQGRLPAGARDLKGTRDLVQVTFLRALEKVETFEARGEGAFLAYLRRILMNQIYDEIRRSKRRPQIDELDDNVAQVGPSPLEEALGEDTLRRYEAALTALPEEQREAVVLRIEMGFTHQQVADAIGSPSANAARMLVTRALMRMAVAMDE
jgi:RNA polymerase sigma factor (sigma-70 family)